MLNAKSKTLLWDRKGPIGPPREIRGRDVMITVQRPGRIVYLQGPRDGAGLSSLLASLGAINLPLSGHSAGDDQTRLLAITDDSFYLIQQACEPIVMHFADAFDVALNVTDAWTRISVCGRQAIALLAKGCALDFHSSAFPAGACAAVGFAQMRTVIWRPRDDFAYHMMIGRSYALSFWDWLLEAGEEYACMDNPQHTHEVRL